MESLSSFLPADFLDWYSGAAAAPEQASALRKHFVDPAKSPVNTSLLLCLIYSETKMKSVFHDLSCKQDYWSVVCWMQGVLCRSLNRDPRAPMIAVTDMRNGQCASAVAVICLFPDQIRSDLAIHLTETLLTLHLDVRAWK